MAFIITKEEWKTVLRHAKFEREVFGVINSITDSIYSREISDNQQSEEYLYEDNPDFLEII